MTVHQCPKCELRFERKAELDDHCWHDHPQFRHEYPASAPPPPAPEPVPHHELAPPPKKPVAQRLAGWLSPARPGDIHRQAHHEGHGTQGGHGGHDQGATQEGATQEG